MRCAALPVVVGNDRRVTRALIAAAVQLVREQDGRILLLGLHESDPLLPHVRDLSGRAFNTRLYLVFWDDERPDIEALTRRVPYLELGCL